MRKKYDSSMQFDPNLMSWKKELVNDLESVTCSMYPELKDIKDYLYEKGAIYASMSGSGSSIYGIFCNKLKSIMPSFVKKREVSRDLIKVFPLFGKEAIQKICLFIFIR